MCGIYNHFALNDLATKKNYKSIAEKIQHRGPNEHNIHVYAYGKYYFRSEGFRLSIIDTQSTKTNPYIWQQYVLSYNGEIYNYKELKSILKNNGYQFTTETDTEVLIKWFDFKGPDSFLQDLNGMFAFTIFDNKQLKLYCVRDRAGEKPLYYKFNNSEIFVSSEIKSLLDNGSYLIDDLKDKLARLEFLSGKDTIFGDVKKFLPGTITTFNFNSNDCLVHEKEKKYWQLPEVDGEIKYSTNLIDELEWLITDSCKLRMIADVPVGLYTSGGLDSAIIAMINKPEFLYFCNFDQVSLERAQAIAKLINSKLVVIEPTKKDFIENIDKIVWYLEDMVGSLSVLPLFMLSQRASKDVKVVLSGEGADEIFGGYVRYLIPFIEQKLTKDFFGQKFSSYLPTINKYYQYQIVKFELINSRTEPDLSHKIAKINNNSIGRNFGALEFYENLQALLHMGDHMAMANSIENRCPFLDYRLIELAMKLPDDIKFLDNRPKGILKDIALRLGIPSNIIWAEKHGLYTPINQWFNWGEKFDRHKYNDFILQKITEKLL